MIMECNLKGSDKQALKSIDMEKDRTNNVFDKQKTTATKLKN